MPHRSERKCCEFHISGEVCERAAVVRSKRPHPVTWRDGGFTSDGHTESKHVYACEHHRRLWSLNVDFFEELNAT